MKVSPTSIVMAIVIVILIVIVVTQATKKAESYTKFYAKSNQPRNLPRVGLSGGLCLGLSNNKSGQQLTFNSGYCDDFNLGNNELISSRTGNSISAYYNANADGQPLEYTNMWRGQKFAFDVQGSENGRSYGTLRHIQSGKCLHPEGGSPDSTGQRLVVWGDCSPQDRIMYSAY